MKGFIINKFRGDKTLLDPGVRMLEERGGIPVVGVVPCMELDLDDEDSLAPRLARTDRPPVGKPVEIAVVRLPHLSNFTDFNVFSRIPEADLRYVSRPASLGDPDMVILPGTKNTMADLRWLRKTGMAAAVDALRRKGRVIFGICGGFQMLSRRISDPDGAEEGGTMEGLGFLDAETVFVKEKRRARVRGRIGELPGILRPLSGMEVEGYEIHMGRTMASIGEAQAPAHGPDVTGVPFPDGAARGNVYGTYVHGVFDAAGIAGRVIRCLAEEKGLSPVLQEEQKDGSFWNASAYNAAQYDLLAETLRKHLDIPKIYEILMGAE